MKESERWRERYRILFEQNVAGTILTTPEGRIVDCNEPCARIFGFGSREAMLAHSAWDFYFKRAERQTLLDRLRTQGSCPAEEVCLRAGNGAAIWVLAKRTVANYGEGLPMLLLGTLIDVTSQKKAQANPQDQEGQLSADQSAQIAPLLQQIGNIVRRLSKSLQPVNLSQMDRVAVQECFVAIEHMKMLIAELEILRIGQD